MRNVSVAFVGSVVITALAPGPASNALASVGEDERPAGLRIPNSYRPWPRGFDVQVLVGGRPLSREAVDGERRVGAVVGAEYELRLTNPLPERVAVAVSVDGLNVIDARHTAAWDASKWVIHPYGTLTLTGWQVGPERARRFYFTTERDAYATRIGRTGDFGIISAVFYRERHPVAEPLSRRPAVPGWREPVGAADAHAEGAALRSAPGGDESQARERLTPSWRHDGRAATGIGGSVPSAVHEVRMELERHPVAVVTLRYDFRPSPPRPIIIPGFAPEPGEPEWGRRWEVDRFAPEP